MNRYLITIITIFIVIAYALTSRTVYTYAEQSGDSPDSGVNSRIIDIYDGLVALGYGSDDAGEWGNMGAIWNRLKSASEWIPNGNITTSDVYPGKTFYNGSRELQTGTAIVGKYVEQGLQAYQDDYCTNNNEESDLACPVGGVEGEDGEAVWIKTAEGGTAASVTDNGVTVSLVNNTVYKDTLSGLYWSNISATKIDAEFIYEIGNDLVNPTGESCNLLSAGDANQYCDNQDVTGTFVEDNDVSAAELCLNLRLDADNADGDNNGLTGVESDWRLPTPPEICQANVDGVLNYLPNSNAPYRVTTSDFRLPPSDMYSNVPVFAVSCNVQSNYIRNENNDVRCVRGY